MRPWTNSPTREEATDALKKGLGRAYVWSQAGRIPANCLLDACLNDYRFDRQVEDARGDWLYQLLAIASLTERFQESILVALRTIESSDVAAQLCQLARHYALHGGDDFRRQLLRIVTEMPVKDCEWLGEKELIQLDGEQGFLVAVRRHGIDLESRDWEWFDGALVDTAMERLGEQRALEALEAYAAKECHVTRFRDAWRSDHDRRTNDQQIPYRERVSAYSADNVIQAAEQSTGRYFSFRGWGRLAEERELLTVYERMLATSNVESLQRLLQVFATRTWPRFDARMLQLCMHPNEKVRIRAARAVANNKHPEVRRFALEHHRDPTFQAEAIEMLAANYEKDDERLLLDALHLPNDECARHWILMSLLKLIEAHPVATCPDAVAVVFENTPCSSCRNSLIEICSERHGLFECLRDECKFDVEADTRSIAGGPAWNE
jgi:hypothetical protein